MLLFVIVKLYVVCFVLLLGFCPYNGENPQAHHTVAFDLNITCPGDLFSFRVYRTSLLLSSSSSSLLLWLLLLFVRFSVSCCLVVGCPVVVVADGLFGVYLSKGEDQHFVPILLVCQWACLVLGCPQTLLCCIYCWLYDTLCF